MRKSTRERFEAKVDRQPDGCWKWTGYRDRATGYGMLATKRPDGKWQPDAAHRVSHELYVGPIADGLVVDHLCRNRACVNPDHLEAVTPQTNFLRSHHPSAVALRTGQCKRGHPLEPGVECRACQKSRYTYKPRPTLVDRLEAKSVRLENGCVIWTGAKANGYAAINVHGTVRLAGRVVFEIAYGAPIGNIDRTCDTHDCLNAAHLRVKRG